MHSTSVERQRRRARLALLSLSTILATGVAAPAMAQLQSGSAPPPVQFTDQNGVDLKSGNYVEASKPLGLGDANSPSLSYSQIKINTNSNSGTPIIGYLQRYYCQAQGEDCVEYWVARIGDQTMTFELGSDGKATAFTGETLLTDDSSKYTIYDKQGTEWVFSRNDPPNPYGQTEVGEVSGAKYRDGRTLTYKRNSNLDLFVFSSDGYEMVVRSGQSSVTLINNAVDYCDPTGACDLTRTWPTFTVTGTGLLNAVHSDPMQRQTTINTSFIMGTGGGSDSTIQRPGGLVEHISQRSVTIGQTGSTFNQIMAVTSYSNGYWGTTYDYQGDFKGPVLQSTATNSDNTTVGFDQNTSIDQLGHRTDYGFDQHSMFYWSSTNTAETLLTYKSLPEGLSQTWHNNDNGDVDESHIHAKANADTSLVASTDLKTTIGYPSTCFGASCHLPLYSIDAKLKRTDYEYYDNGLIKSETLPPDDSGVRPKTRYEYEPRYAVFKQVAGGQATTGPAVMKLTRKSTCRSLSEDGCVRSIDETVTTYTYDDNLLVASQTVQPGNGSPGLTTTYKHDQIGNVEWVDGPADGSVDRTYYFWNADRELVGTIGPDPVPGDGTATFQATRTLYNDDGLPTLVQTGSASAQTLDALNAMSVTTQHETKYDTLGRKTEERVEKDGTTYQLTQYSYNVSNRLECTAVRMNPDVFSTPPASACDLGTEGSFGPDRITHNLYDAAGRLLHVQVAYKTDKQADYANYTWSDDGKRTSVADAKGNLSTMGYNGLDQQVSWAFPSKDTAGVASSSDHENYRYDANGNRTWFRKRDGSVLTYAYDALNRMTEKHPSDGSRAVYYAYDLQGRPTSARFGSQLGGDAVLNIYNGLGRLQSTTTSMAGATRSLSFGYDAHGNRTSVQYPDGKVVSSHYDGLDRLSELLEGSDPGAVSVGSFTYDIDGRPLSRMGGGSGNCRDANGQITSQFVGAVGYCYDPIGRLSSLNINVGAVGTTSLAYNPASQIVSEARSNDSYAYTGASNASQSYGVNGLNQYNAVGNVVPTYDDNGNLKSNGSAGYGYDIENRLISGPNNVGLTYDPLGRLWQVTGASGTTQFLYDGDQLTAEYDGSTNLLRRYVHGPGEDDPLLWYEGVGLDAGSRRMLIADHQGSIVQVVDANESPLAINSYDEFGGTATNNPSMAQRFRFTAQAWLPELGLYHYKARVYSPQLGRFLQTDPVGYDDQINLYAYVANDPVNKVDPNGQEIVVVGSREYRREVLREMRQIQSGPNGNALAHGLIVSNNQIVIRPTADQPKVDGDSRYVGSNHTTSDAADSGNGKGTGSTVYFDPKTTGGIDVNGSSQRPSFVGLGHELGQAEANDRGNHVGSYPTQPTPGTTPPIEQNAMTRENQIRQEHGLPDRTTFFPPGGCAQGPGKCQ